MCGYSSIPFSPIIYITDSDETIFPCLDLMPILSTPNLMYGTES